MDLSTVAKVEVLDKHWQVNEYLALGWKLLKIYTTAYDTEGPAANHQTAHYIMGWMDGDPKYPPETTYPWERCV